MSEHVYEAAVIGAGPIGLEIAIALKRAGVDYVHFDAKQVGYTVSWFAPQTRFFSSNERIAIAGVPLFTPDQSKASREQYLTYLRSIVEQFDLAVNTYEPVVNLEHIEAVFRLTTRPASGERMWRARRVILVTGAPIARGSLTAPVKICRTSATTLAIRINTFGAACLSLVGRTARWKQRCAAITLVPT